MDLLKAKEVDTSDVGFDRDLPSASLLRVLHFLSPGASVTPHQASPVLFGVKALPFMVKRASTLTKHGVLNSSTRHRPQRRSRSAHCQIWNCIYTHSQVLIPNILFVLDSWSILVDPYPKEQWADLI